jgi:transposase
MVDISHPNERRPRMTTTATERKTITEGGVLHLALELGRKKWTLGFTIGLGQKPRKKNVGGGDTAAVVREIAAAKRRFHLAENARVVSCYEAGPDGFWIHRWLVSIGVENAVVDSASIEVNRRKRRAKSDGLEVEGLLKLLCRHTMGEPKVWSVVRVPPPQIEDLRQLHRDLATLTEERTRIRNRMRSLLAVQGASIQSWSQVREEVATLRLWDGAALGEGLRRRLEREIERLDLVQRQIRDIERAMQAELEMEAVPGSALAMMQRLVGLRAIGPQGARIMALELFSWREFRNRRQVGGVVGLTPTPYQSGNTAHEQGIDKAGNVWLRRVATQLAWGWVRWQPHSELTVWFNRRFAQAGRRQRRVGIVALARRLLIALWRYVFGSPLQGTVTGAVEVYVLKAA